MAQSDNLVPLKARHLSSRIRVDRISCFLDDLDRLDQRLSELPIAFKSLAHPIVDKILGLTSSIQNMPELDDVIRLNIALWPRRELAGGKNSSDLLAYAGRLCGRLKIFPAPTPFRLYRSGSGVRRAQIRPECRCRSQGGNLRAGLIRRLTTAGCHDAGKRQLRFPGGKLSACFCHHHSSRSL